VSEDAYILFDDTVLINSTSIEVATAVQCGVSAEELFRRTAVMNIVSFEALIAISCVYVNGETRQFWVIDRIDGDGQSKLEPCDCDAQWCGVQQKQLPFTTVLMDSWYATQKIDGAG